MSEKLIQEEEFEGFTLKVFWGLPLGYEEYELFICTVVVLLKEKLMFKVQVQISYTAERTARNSIKDKYSGIIKPPFNEDNIVASFMTNYAIKIVQNKIKSGDFKEGEIYEFKIMNDNVKSWVNEVKDLFI